MKFKMNRKVFLSLVQSVAPAVASKSTTSVLEFFKVEAIDSRVELSATNMEVSLKAFRAAEVSSPGVIILKGHILQSIVSNSTSDDVEVELKGSKIQINTGRSVFNVPVADPTQFPPVHQYSSFTFQSVKKDFLDQVGRVAYAAAKDDHRFHLKAVYVQPSEMVATDGHRLAILRSELPIDKPALVPAEAFGVLRKAFSKSEGDDLGMFKDTKNNLHFHKGDMAASLRLLEADYVDYAQVLPKGEFQEMVVQKDRLHDALKLVTLVSDKINHVRFTLKEGMLTLETRSEEVGEAIDRVEAQHKEPAEFALNSKYLADVLERIEGDTVQFELRGPKNPVLIREKDYVAIIMPQALKY